MKTVKRVKESEEDEKCELTRVKALKMRKE
jgi:hypothetical protein